MVNSINFNLPYQHNQGIPRVQWSPAFFIAFNQTIMSHPWFFRLWINYFCDIYPLPGSTLTFYPLLTDISIGYMVNYNMGIRGNRALMLFLLKCLFIMVYDTERRMNLYRYNSYSLRFIIQC